MYINVYERDGDKDSFVNYSVSLLGSQHSTLFLSSRMSNNLLDIFIFAHFLYFLGMKPSSEATILTSLQCILGFHDRRVYLIDK